jgi:NAD(P)-dependent dehydrogenase (short-subunit alcohol dehydrogenase family)
VSRFADADHLFPFTVIATSRSSLGRLPDASNIHRFEDVDLLLPGAPEEFIRRAGSLIGGDLAIVHCAGYFGGFENIRDTTTADAMRCINGNYLTLVAITKAVLPLMVAMRGGQIVAFSSHAVYQSYPLMATFLPAKAAVESFVRCLANEYAPYGIIANAFAPATIDCDTERALVPHGDYEHWLQPADVATVILRHVTSHEMLLSGNVLQLFRYSETYFGRGFLQRIEKKL